MRVEHASINGIGSYAFPLECGSVSRILQDVSVTGDSSPLAHAYHRRLGRFVSEENYGDWRLKLYGLAAPDKGVRPELLAVTRELAASSLPRRRGHTRRRVRDRTRRELPDRARLLVAGHNELHQRVFVGRPDDLSEMLPVELTPAGCVWELGIVEFERRAWIEDVIGNADGPDIDRYMSRRFDGLI